MPWLSSVRLEISKLSVKGDIGLRALALWSVPKTPIEIPKQIGLAVFAVKLFRMTGDGLDWAMGWVSV